MCGADAELQEHGVRTVGPQALSLVNGCCVTFAQKRVVTLILQQAAVTQFLPQEDPHT